MNTKFIIARNYSRFKLWQRENPDTKGYYVASPEYLFGKGSLTKDDFVFYDDWYAREDADVIRQYINYACVGEETKHD